MCSETELRNLIEAVRAPDVDKAASSKDIISCLGLDERLHGREPLSNIVDALDLAEEMFPGEYWEVSNHDNHPHYVSWRYNALLGGKAVTPVRMGGDSLEQAVVLAVLALTLQQVQIKAS